jgi:hypothetical protein
MNSNFVTEIILKTKKSIFYSFAFDLTHFDQLLSAQGSILRFKKIFSLKNLTRKTFGVFYSKYMKKWTIILVFGKIAENCYCNIGPGFASKISEHNFILLIFYCLNIFVNKVNNEQHFEKNNLFLQIKIICKTNL